MWSAVALPSFRASGLGSIEDGVVDLEVTVAEGDLTDQWRRFCNRQRIIYDDQRAHWNLERLLLTAHIDRLRSDLIAAQKAVRRQSDLDFPELNNKQHCSSDASFESSERNEIRKEDDSDYFRCDDITSLSSADKSRRSTISSMDRSESDNMPTKDDPGQPMGQAKPRVNVNGQKHEFGQNGSSDG